MRRVVRLVSSNVQLPVLPDARMDTRNEIGSLSQAPRCEELRAGTGEMMANCDVHVNNSNAGDELKNKLVAGELVAVEVAHDRSSEAVGLEKFLGQALDIRSGDFFQHGDQFLRGVVPVEINVIASKTGHALPGPFESQKRGAF